jgi:hypothetical protein
MCFLLFLDFCWFFKTEQNPNKIPILKPMTKQLSYKVFSLTLKKILKFHQVGVFLTPFVEIGNCIRG